MNNVAAKRAPTPQSLTAKDVQHFLSNYKKAWETQDSELAAGLFTRDAQYKQGPFTPAIVGREAIHDYWAAATARQIDIHFTVGSVIQRGYLLAAEWRCTYQERSTSQNKELAGMLFADFYGKQVRHFREYWQSRTL